MIPMDPIAYLRKAYAGFLGMNAGIRLGAPVEPVPWTYARIRDFYGEIDGYLRDYRTFAADDDVNGPVYFLRALDDNGGLEPTPEDVGEAWLNYARDGLGMFWWGGFGVSTEHTAYTNLARGVKAPLSGSAELNGRAIAEQIGGQIFIDTWGLIAPGDPARAARMARAAASVSHDGEGLHGAAFIAGCIAAAFTAGSMDEVVAAGLACVEADSTYAGVIRAVGAFHAAHPDDWRGCYEMLEANWGYDRYPGVCPIIPNAGVCVLALCYGQGDFARTIEIATMCGLDTDCNAGNVGTIAGVFAGLSGIPQRYREPMNDQIVLGGISGTINNLDAPTYAYELARHAYRLLGGPLPECLSPRAVDGETRFDFSLPGSTHGFRADTPNHLSLRHAQGQGRTGNCLGAAFRVLGPGDACRIFWKPFFRRADFHDERYRPAFSPKACPGQRVGFWVRVDRWEGQAETLIPYVRESFTGKEYRCGEIPAKAGEWQQVRFTIPDLSGGTADEVGLLLIGKSTSGKKSRGILYLDDFTVEGAMDYTIDPAKTATEFGSLLPFSHQYGTWTAIDGRFCGETDRFADLMTGNYFLGDASIEAEVWDLSGGALLSLRVAGARRGYYAGIRGGEAVILCKLRGGLQVLASVPYPSRHARLCFEAKGNTLSLAADGKPILSAEDDSIDHGMTGFAVPLEGRGAFGVPRIRGSVRGSQQHAPRLEEEMP